MLRRRDFIKGVGALAANSFSSTFSLAEPIGFASNHNEFIWSPIAGGNKCNPLTNLVVQVEVTRDIIVPFGMAFQLNCWTPLQPWKPSESLPPLPPLMAFQQYVIGYDPINWTPPKIGCSIETFPSPLARPNLGIPSGDLTNNSFALIQAPKFLEQGLPAGTILNFTLRSDPTNKNITGADFHVQVPLSSAPISGSGGSTPIEGGVGFFTYADRKWWITNAQNLSLSRDIAVDKGKDLGKRINPLELPPIMAVQMNVVGLAGGRYTYLQAGGGTITYASTAKLQAIKALPADSDPQLAVTSSTEEESNVTYTPFTGGKQNFNASQVLISPGGPFAVSQQFGLLQTDLFAIAVTGQLVVFFVSGSGHWSKKTDLLGPVNMAHPNCCLAATLQNGTDNQTNVFLIDQNNQLQMFSVVGGERWNGPSQISDNKLSSLPQGAPLATYQQGNGKTTGVCVFDNNGQLNIFSVKGAGNIPQAPVLIGLPTGLVSSGFQLSVRQDGGNVSVFFVDTSGTVNMVSFDDPARKPVVAHLPGNATLARPEAFVKIGKGGASAGGCVATFIRGVGNNSPEVLLVNKQGQLTILKSGNASEPAKLVGKPGAGFAASPGAPIAVYQQQGSNQTSVFVVDINGTLNMFWVDGTGDNWNGPQKIGKTSVGPVWDINSTGAYVVASPQFGIAGQIDVFIIDQTGAPTVTWGNAPSSGWPTKVLVSEV